MGALTLVPEEQPQPPHPPLVRQKMSAHRRAKDWRIPGAQWLAAPNRGPSRLVDLVGRLVSFQPSTSGPSPDWHRAERPRFWAERVRSALPAARGTQWDAPILHRRL